MARETLMKYLLLYDMKETALAKDVRDFCGALGVKLELIPLKPNNIGRTLGDKEAKHFKDCDGVVFLVTPREADGTISASVVHELGQATIKFENAPDKVVILAEENCKFPPIEQRARNTFVRSDAGSVVRALTVLVEELHIAGLIATNRDLGDRPPTAEFEAAKKTKGLVEMVTLISQQDKVVISEEMMDQWLSGSLKLTQQEINFVKYEFKKHNLAESGYNGYEIHGYYWRLTGRGIDLARVAAERGFYQSV